MRIIEDDMLKVVEKMRAISNNPAIYYMYGHPVEMNGRLLLMDQDPINSQKKYPLVALRLDNPAPTGGDIVNYNLTILLMVYSEEINNAEERQTKSFKSKLYPLYELYIRALRESRLFMWPVTLNGKGNLLVPEHVRIDRYYAGTSSSKGNVANIFTDPLDVIEITDLKINSRDKKC